MYSRAYLHPDLDGKWQNLVNTSLFQSLNTILQYIFDVRKSIILSFRLFSPTELIYSFTEVFRLLLHRHHRYSVTIFRYFLTKYYLVKYIISNEYLSALWRQKAEKNRTRWWNVRFVRTFASDGKSLSVFYGHGMKDGLFVKLVHRKKMSAMLYWRKFIWCLWANGS